MYEIMDSSSSTLDEYEEWRPTAFPLGQQMCDFVQISKQEELVSCDEPTRPMEYAQNLELDLGGEGNQTGVSGNKEDIAIRFLVTNDYSQKYEIPQNVNCLNVKKKEMDCQTIITGDIISLTVYEDGFTLKSNISDVILNGDINIKNNVLQGDINSVEGPKSDENNALSNINSYCDVNLNKLVNSFSVENDGPFNRGSNSDETGSEVPTSVFKETCAHSFDSVELPESIFFSNENVQTDPLHQTSHPDLLSSILFLYLLIFYLPLIFLFSLKQNKK